MNRWEKVNGKVIQISDPDESGNIKIKTDKNKLLIFWNKFLANTVQWISNNVHFKDVFAFLFAIADVIISLIFVICCGIIFCAILLWSVQFILTHPR